MLNRRRVKIDSGKTPLNNVCLATTRINEPFFLASKTQMAFVAYPKL